MRTARTRAITNGDGVWRIEGGAGSPPPWTGIVTLGSDVFLIKADGSTAVARLEPVPSEDVHSGSCLSLGLRCPNSCGCSPR